MQSTLCVIWAEDGPHAKKSRKICKGLQLFLYRVLCLSSVEAAENLQFSSAVNLPFKFCNTVGVGLVQLHEVLELVTLVLAQRKSSEDFQHHDPFVYGKHSSAAGPAFDQCNIDES